MGKGNKYYTPELSEFYEEFEFEECVDGKTWDKERSYTPNEFIKNNKFELQEWISENRIRVKYLDQQDIEECGFIFKEYDKYRNVDVFIRTKELGINQLETTKISLFKDSPGQLLLGYSTDTGYEEQSIYKYMKIKNKTEFKKLLKMLGI